MHIFNSFQRLLNAQTLGTITAARLGQLFLAVSKQEVALLGQSVNYKGFFFFLSKNFSAAVMVYWSSHSTD